MPEQKPSRRGYLSVQALSRIIHPPSYYLTKRSIQTRSASEVSALLRLACASGWCGLMNNPG